MKQLVNISQISIQRIESFVWLVDRLDRTESEL